MSRKFQLQADPETFIELPGMSSLPVPIRPSQTSRATPLRAADWSQFSPSAQSSPLGFYPAPASPYTSSSGIWGSPDSASLSPYSDSSYGRSPPTFPDVISSPASRALLFNDQSFPDQLAPPASPFLDSLSNSLATVSLTGTPPVPVEFLNQRGDIKPCIELSDVFKAHAFLPMATDKRGIAYLFHQLIRALTPVEKDRVIHDLAVHINDIVFNIHGHVLLQDLFLCLPEFDDIVETLLFLLRGRMFELSNTKHSCRVLQRAVEVLQKRAATLGHQELCNFVSELRSHVCEVAKNVHGCHFLSKVFELRSPDLSAFCVDEILEQNETPVLAGDRHGCRVVQALLECGSPQQRTAIIDQLLGLVISGPNKGRIRALATDPFANYVLQTIVALKHKEDNANERILAALTDHLNRVARCQYGSHVIEACLVNGTQEQIATLVSEVLEDPKGNTLKELLLDPYGNYVVQRMFDTAEMGHKNALVRRIMNRVPGQEPLYGALNKLNYGHRIINRLRRFLHGESDRLLKEESSEENVHLAKYGGSWSNA